MTEHELIDYGVSTGWLTPEKAEQLKKIFRKLSGARIANTIVIMDYQQKQ